MKYKKKPVIIEAVEFKGFLEDDDFSERPDWLLKAIYDDNIVKFFDKPGLLTINTLEGPIYASPGDFIIKGIQGEIYPCKPDIFKQTYESINDI